MALARILLTFLLVAPSSGQNDPGWIQPRADAAGTSSVDYATVTADPVIQSRRKLGTPVYDPVSWGKTLYTAYGDGRDRALVAIDVISGEVVASATLGRGDGVHLAVWQGMVLVVEPDGVRTFRHEGGRQKSVKRIRGKFLGEPCLVEGTALLAGDEGLLAVDVTRGRVLETVDGPYRGRPAFVRMDEEHGRKAVQRIGDRETVELVTLDVERLGHRKPELGDPRRIDLDDRVLPLLNVRRAPGS